MHSCVPGQCSPWFCLSSVPRLLYLLLPFSDPGCFVPLPFTALPSGLHPFACHFSYSIQPLRVIIFLRSSSLICPNLLSPFLQSPFASYFYSRFLPQSISTTLPSVSLLWSPCSFSSLFHYWVFSHHLRFENWIPNPNLFLYCRSWTSYYWMSNWPLALYCQKLDVKNYWMSHWLNILSHNTTSLANVRGFNTTVKYQLCQICCYEPYTFLSYEIEMWNKVSWFTLHKWLLH